MLVVAAKRYLYHAGYYILNSSAINLCTCDAWQAPLSLPPGAILSQARNAGTPSIWRGAKPLRQGYYERPFRLESN